MFFWSSSVLFRFSNFAKHVKFAVLSLGRINIIYQNCKHKQKWNQVRGFRIDLVNFYILPLRDSKIRIAFIWCIWSSYLYFQWRLHCWLSNFDYRLHDLSKACRFILWPVVAPGHHLAEDIDKVIDDQVIISGEIQNWISRSYQIDENPWVPMSAVLEHLEVFIGFSRADEIDRTCSVWVIRYDCTVSYRVSRRTLRWSNRKLPPS